MAVIDDTRAAADWIQSGYQSYPDETYIIQKVKQHFWIWFYDHRREVVLSFLFWKVRLEELKPLFERIFGAMPPVSI